MSTITGTDQNDTINAGAGDDTINTGAGDDTIDAGAGDDIVYGGAGDDIIDAGDGDDIIIFSNDEFVIDTQFNYSIDGFPVDIHRSLARVANVDGGDGTDRVSFEYPKSTSFDAVYFSDSSLNSVEVVQLETGPKYFVGSHAFNNVDRWELAGGKITVISKEPHTDLNFNNVSLTSNIKVDLAGTFRNIDTSNLNTGDIFLNSPYFRKSLNTVIAGDTATM